MTPKISKAAIILTLFAATTLAVKFENSVCSEYIVQFPKYKCVQQKSIGQGANGIAFPIKRDGRKYMLKVQKTRVRRDKAFNDIKFLKLLTPSTYVINLIEYKEDMNFLYAVLEFGSKGDLDQFIEKNPHRFTDSKTILKFFLNIVEALIYIHGKKVSHNDIKPQNIVVMEDERLKFIDFDVALSLGTKANGRGTMEYMDPEIIKTWGTKSLLFNEKRDIYSLGVLLFFMSQKKYPFNGGDSIETWQKAHKSSFYTFRQGTPVSIAQIASLCLIAQEQHRPSLETIKKMTEDALSETDSLFLQSKLQISNKDEVPFTFQVQKSEESHGNLETENDEESNETIETEKGEESQENTATEKNEGSQKNTETEKDQEWGQHIVGDNNPGFYSKIRVIVMMFLIALAVVPWVIWYLFFSPNSAENSQLSDTSGISDRELKSTRLNLRDLEIGLKPN